MRILLLSAYDAQSHQAWHQGLVRALPSHQWQVESLPARFFAWRFRGNALAWSASFQDASFDLILATSMTDLATLRGLCPSLATCPAILYFHENQFAYPLEQTNPRDLLHFQITQLYSALSADRLIFNSQYNQDSFLQGVRQLLEKMPDAVPEQAKDILATRSAILPVPLAKEAFPSHQSPQGPLQLLWNHRWEFDKAPERFFAALSLLKKQGIPFEVHVVGQRFRSQPPCFEQAKAAFGAEIRTWGYLPKKADYRSLLRQCDLVISTALHEFQGLAVLEACAAGCLPIVPNRLAYPQFFDDTWCYASFEKDEKAEAQALAEKIAFMASDMTALRALPRLDLTSLSWDVLALKYQESFEDVVRMGRISIWGGPPCPPMG